MEIAIKIALTFAEGIASELGSFSVSWGLPYIRPLLCFDSEKKKLLDTLSTVRSAISQLENQQERSLGDEDWLQKLQGIFYDAEDLVEDLKDEKQRQDDVNRHLADKVWSRFSTPCFYISKALDMKTIRERLNAAAADRNSYHPGSQAGGLGDGSSDPNETHSHENEPDVIGRQGDKRAIKKLLKDQAKINKEHVSIIPIIGIGGIGKTSLARLVYNDKERDRIRFNLKMWVYVSTVFDEETLIRKVLAAAGGTSPNLGKDLLQEQLRGKLKDKKYLLVLDYVWSTNSESWIALKNLLNVGARGSIILVTARDRDVAKIMSTVPPYVLRGLSEAHCESLFQQRAYKPGQMEQYPGLLDIGEKILAQCGRNPLAIRTATSLLSLYKEEKDQLKREKGWWKVKNELWKQAKDNNYIFPILKVSYKHLPLNLKKCFAYCSLFPKGTEIEKATLIQLWMAQQFIQPSDNRTSEDNGDEDFDTLWKKFFFQDEKMDAYGNVISCKMNDLMHDLVQEVAGYEYSTVNDNSVCISERVIHASVNHSYLHEIPASLVNARKLRTLFVTGILSIGDFDKLASTFKCLRVLCLGTLLCRGSSDVLKSMGKLKRLRYLDLSKSDITTLPRSVCELKKLETLKLNDCKSLTELPRDIGRLINLRHLENYGCDSLGGMPSEIGQLTSIQTLPLFVLGRGGLSALNDLNNLRGELRIKNLEIARNAPSEAREASLENKKNLQTLTLYWRMHEGSADEDAALLENLKPNHNLKGLHIRGYCGVKFPNWMLDVGNVRSLQSLTIHHCKKLTSLPRGLQHLIALEKLEISDCPELNFSDEGNDMPGLRNLQLLQLSGLKKLVSLPNVLQRAKSLKYLEIKQCPNLMTLPDWLGNLSSLQQLKICCCGKLKSHPEGVHCFTALQELTIRGCTSFWETCQKGNEQGLTKITHISEIDSDGELS